MKLALLVLPALLLVGCVEPSLQRPTVKKTQVANFTDGTLMTVEYEGHKFIVYEGYEKGGLVHHPSCSCGR